jgi:hypothetical protein
MSLYEALAIVALLGAGGFAYYLYRSDTRPKLPGETPELPESQPMFARDRRDGGKPGSR